MNWLRRIFARWLPQPIAVTFTEGGNWHSFPLTPTERKEMRSQFHNTGITVHAIMFDDGNCWDAVNGWRDDIHFASLYGITVAQYRKMRMEIFKTNR